jgi:fructose-1,6-bisphosphatase/inositol monophosphatase family enzyme
VLVTRYSDELRFAVKFAGEAAERICQIAARGYRIDSKSDRSLVTTADREINRWFIERAAHDFPDYSIIGEESSRPVSGSHRAWVIDPIDGTQHFVLGIPVFMVSIALVESGQPVVGVAYNPSTRECYWGAQGMGAYRGGVRLQVSLRDGAGEQATIGGSAVRQNAGGPDADSLLRISTAPSLIATSCRYVWPSVFSGCKVAEGAWDAYLNDSSAAHDVAAVCVLVREAGGRVTDRAGADQRYDRPVNGCLLSNGHLHDVLLRYWRGGALSHPH